MSAFENFMNPFSVPDKDHLYCISSGRRVPADAASDLLDVNTHGQTAYRDFVQERLVQRTTSFHAPIKRLKLKTFASIAVSREVSSTKRKTKELVAERNLFGQLILLSIAHHISLEKVLEYPLGPVPWSLAMADGTPTKTNKAKLLHKLENGQTVVEKPTNISYVIDGNATFHELMQIPNTFEELALKIFSHLPRCNRVDFVTDTYKAKSIKSMERERRGCSSELLIQGPLTKVPRDFKRFLSNENNKTHLIHLITKEWRTDKYAIRLVGRQIMVVDGEDCWCLSSTDGVTTDCNEVSRMKSTQVSCKVETGQSWIRALASYLSSNKFQLKTGLCVFPFFQEEADTRIILHALDISHQAEDCSIIIRSPDTEVFVLLIKYAHEVGRPLLMDTGTGDKRRLIDITAIAKDLGPDISTALPALHAFTGCDTTSAFVRKGKITPLRILKNNPRYTPSFTSLGTSSDLTDDQFQNLEAFTCLLYGSKSGVNTSINKLRYTMFTTRFTPNGQLLSSESGIDLSLLPPCASSLRMHIKRVNYQCLIWNRAGMTYPSLPEPEDSNGWILCDGMLQCKWTDGDMLPQELVDLIVEQAVAPEENDYYNVQDILEDQDDIEDDDDGDEWNESLTICSRALFSMNMDSTGYW